MILEFISGAGIKLVGNIITSIFANSAEKERNIHLKDQAILEGHIKLAQIHSKNNVVKFERMCVFFMLVGGFIYISIFSLGDLSNEGRVLIDQNVGWLSRFFNQVDKVPVKVNLSIFIIELWSNLIVLILGAYSVPPRK